MTINPLRDGRPGGWFVGIKLPNGSTLGTPGMKAGLLAVVLSGRDARIARGGRPQGYYAALDSLPDWGGSWFAAFAPRRAAATAAEAQGPVPRGL